ncbi:MAG: bifunctional (p)ppGpp synthetase/guanosine-3',5'-bis(diphosphate) 3'-pyrophosphohydrolase [Candidatus Caldatribacteriota bacterium]|nr:bifunctional (p)ppGpp synthetase/guanosine-3',5'-bis(diphosphate) 3'-pyrophosphohydrolase [Candidatus Caldatribacteriota bacterium]
MLKKIPQYAPQAEIGLVKKAYRFSEKAHKNQKRYSGKKYILHLLEVAKILSDLELDIITITAGILHDAIEDTDIKSPEIEKEFGEEVAMLVNGVTKLSKISFKTQQEQQAESFRKMFLAMAEDVRVILIKLADRLNNMRTLQYLPPFKQKRISRETLEIYVPIANRLGISRIQWELEDLSLRYLKPDKYKTVVKKIAKNRMAREKIVKSIKMIIKKELEKVKIKAEIQGRPKNIYSIYKKMEEGKKEFFQIYDLTAIRIICNSVKDCYAVLGLLHSIWKPMPGRFKDYIAMPKSNMYQSLHTTVITIKGEPLEIQIRTWEMHQTAEYGIAAHWMYKEKNDLKKDKKLEERLSWLRQILEWQKDLKDPKEFMESLKIGLFQDEVFTFTPKGDVKMLPFGSTPIDFAYLIHTDIGHSCIGAKVNKKIVPLDYKLKSGDIIEVLTSKISKGPSKDWLKLVKTSGARNKIRLWFKREMKEENIRKGRGILEKQLGKYQIQPSLEISKKLKNISIELGFSGLDAMYENIGYGKLTPFQALSKIVPREKITPIIPSGKSKKVTDKGVRVNGIDGVMIKFARCCNPVYGDKIIGYITRGSGISVHKVDCPNINSISKEKDRLVKVEWIKNEALFYPVKIKISSYDRVNLISDIMQIFSNNKVLVSALNATTSKNDVADIDINFSINSLKQLTEITEKIKKIKNVLTVKRVKTF